MALNLTDNEIEEMLKQEIQENGEYITSPGSWAMSTLESFYATCSEYDYDTIVKDNFDKFADIAEKIW